jgi:hypothetical protein
MHSFLQKSRFISCGTHQTNAFLSEGGETPYKNFLIIKDHEERKHLRNVDGTHVQRIRSKTLFDLKAKSSRARFKIEYVAEGRRGGGDGFKATTEDCLARERTILMGKKIIGLILIKVLV